MILTPQGWVVKKWHPKILTSNLYLPSTNYYLPTPNYHCYTIGMAKGRSKNKKKNNKGSLFAEGVATEIVAATLVILALVLTVGFFVENSGTAALLGAMKWLVGNAAYLMPILFIYVAVKIFIREDDLFGKSAYIGLAFIIIALAGLMHLPSVGVGSWAIARDGAGGGLIGYLIDSLVVRVFGAVAGSILLIGMLIIGAIIALDLRLRNILSLFKKEESEDEEVQTGSKKAPKLKSNVPLESSPSKRKKSEDDSKSQDKDDQHALRESADPDWSFPDINLLSDAQEKADAGDWKRNAEIIRETLADFKIDVTMDDINVGPRVTQYTLKPPNGVRLTKITALEQNIALNLAAHSIRIEAPIPGKRAVGIEVPNKKSAQVRLRSILESPAWKRAKSPLTFALGQDISGESMIATLDSMPHLLIAGATGSGKSVMINSLLCSLLYRNSPADLKLILVDPKHVELNLYSDVPHLLTPVITEPEKCISALKWAIAEMERRYGELSEHGKRNIVEFNKLKSEDNMPYIVIVIDELADLMMAAARDVEALIVRLAQKARATGIHLVLATQRPSVDIITGLIKANIPTRIAFTVASQVDSRTILDQAGAEKLLGEGDMLFNSPNLAKPKRVQGVLIEESEARSVTDHLRKERAPEYNNDVISQPVSLSGKGGIVADIDSTDDSLYEDAVKVVVDSKKASASLLQRRLRVGYARAARLIETMEEQGIIGPADGQRPREVLINSMDSVNPDADKESDSESYGV